MATRTAALPVAQIAHRPFHRLIGYANCWEDPVVLARALQVGPGDICLSVTSGGCNTLSLLLADPARVVAIDFNPSQNHLLRLKMAAIAELDHGELLEFLGVRPSDRRKALYERVRLRLTMAARAFWDDHVEMLERGVLYQGRLERYMGAFGKLLTVLFGRSRLERLWASESIAEQRRTYAEHWDGWRWRTLFDVFFSRAVISRAKDKHHFRYVDLDGFGRRFRARAQHILTDLPLEDNWFMRLSMLGRFDENAALPDYLRAENHAVLRSRLGRVEIVDGDLEGYLSRLHDGTFTRFNMSNLFDWFPEDRFEAAHREIVRVARDGARLCWWNTLAVRHLPPSVPQIVAEDALASELLSQDRFIYAQFQVGRIRKA